MMKKHKNFAFATITCLLLILFGANRTMAQASGQGFRDKTPEQRAQLETDAMTTNLKLDSGQTIKVQNINLKYAQKMDAALKSDGRRLAKLKQVKSIREQKKEELKPVLTADQYKQFEAMQAAMKERFKSSGTPQS